MPDWAGVLEVWSLDLKVLQCRSNLAPRKARECAKNTHLDNQTFFKFLRKGKCRLPTPLPNGKWHSRHTPSPHSRRRAERLYPRAFDLRHGLLQTQILNPSMHGSYKLIAFTSFRRLRVILHVNVEGVFFAAESHINKYWLSRIEQGVEAQVQEVTEDDCE